MEEDEVATKLALELIHKALEGDAAAYDEIMNSAYGNIKNEAIFYQKKFDPSKYTSEELQQLSALMKKSYDTGLGE